MTRESSIEPPGDIGVGNYSEVNMIYDVTALDTALRAAGLRIHGCDSTGRVEWIGTPSGQDLATADAVRQAHDPGKRERERKQAAEAMAILRARLLDATEEGTWGVLTAATRLELMRVGLRAIAEMLR